MNKKTELKTKEFPRIIAAFAGCGKSWFCEKNIQALDMAVMPFKYLNFYEIASGFSEGESVKAHYDLEYNVGWEREYYKALLETYHNYPDEIIVIPTVHWILSWLEEDEIPFAIVYPSADAKDVYKERYIARGNNEEFLYIFIEQWDFWMDQVRSHAGGVHIELKKNEYLSDVIPLSAYINANIISDKQSYIARQFFEKESDVIVRT